MVLLHDVHLRLGGSFRQAPSCYLRSLAVITHPSQLTRDVRMPQPYVSLEVIFVICSCDKRFLCRPFFLASPSCSRALSSPSPISR
jgi:hypothetical protein